MALTSRSEGSPLVVSEALAAGVPIVACAVGGVPDQFRDGVEGLLVPPDDPGELAAALLHLLHRPELRARMGRAARRRATAWPHERMVDAVERVYARTAAGLELTG
jgi:glycosyltransferase involved in cell wall biosynthesis